MRVCYVVRAVDENSTIAATQVRWIKALAREPGIERVTVLTQFAGTVQDLPPNVTIDEFGHSKSGLVRLTRSAARLRESVGLYFIAQGGPFPPFIRLAAGFGQRPVVAHWKAHAHVTRSMRFYARYCDDLVFTASSESFPFSVASRRIIGHGVDTDQFSLSLAEPSRDLIVLGTVSPIKRVDLAIHLLKEADDLTGRKHQLHIVGRCNELRQSNLRALARALHVEDRVVFMGPVSHAALPSLLAKYRVSLNMSEGALDKSVLESMATGVPILTSNLATTEVLPPDLRREVVVSGDLALRESAMKLAALLDLTSRERLSLGQRLRAVVERDHALRTFFARVLEEVENYAAGSSYVGPTRQAKRAVRRLRLRGSDQK